jgi:ribosome-binding protein aMBF1 (putative translation factor)
MEKRKLQRVTRNRSLTSEEIAKDQDIRRKVQEEFPPAPGKSDVVTQSIADSLKQAISASGRSVYQIAKESGISQIVIARFLSGERDIRMATADKLARVLNLQLTVGH